MTKSFKEAYDVLNRHANTLRTQQDPNIDDLLGIVTESVEAYKVCKERIDAVEAALREALADPAVAGSADARPATSASDDDQPSPSRPPRSAPPRSSQHKTGFDDMDDEIPF
jgi:exodeoxyribonuclease VII small subunit